MKTLKILIIAVLALAYLIIFIIAAKNRRLIKLLALNALLGIIGLTAVNLLCRYTGVRVEVNEYSVIGSALYGLPAVCGMAVLKLLL